jgi:hypothetical protein
MKLIKKLGFVLFPLFFVLSPVFAQAKKNNGKSGALDAKESKSTRPGTIIYTYDFLNLKVSINIDGKSRSKKLKDSHVYGPAGRYGAIGRVSLSGQFNVAGRTFIKAPERRTCKDVKFKVKCGKLITSKLDTISKKDRKTDRIRTLQIGARLSILRPLDELMIAQRFARVKQLVKGMSFEQINKEIRGLDKDIEIGQGQERKIVLRAMRLKVLKDIERTLLKCKAVAAKDASASKLTLKSTNAEISNLAKNLNTLVKSEIWWTCEVTYQFIFNALGLGTIDGPIAAFVPGSLNKGVGKITVHTKIDEGRARVYWYRLPGFSVADHSLEGVKAPAGWMVRFFGPGPRSRGALLFIRVPEKALGAFEFTWRRNDASGDAVLVHRPKPRSFPY